VQIATFLLRIMLRSVLLCRIFATKIMLQRVRLSERYISYERYIAYEIRSCICSREYNKTILYRMSAQLFHVDRLTYAGNRTLFATPRLRLKMGFSDM